MVKVGTTLVPPCLITPPITQSAHNITKANLKSIGNYIYCYLLELAKISEQLTISQNIQ